MSLINEYRATEEAIKELQGRLKSLSENDKLKKEIEFEGKLRTLMGSYNKRLKDVIAILDPHPVRTDAGKSGKPRAERAIKRYTNPHTNEVVETKGGNHRVLKEWKAKWGAEAVESWAK